MDIGDDYSLAAGVKELQALKRLYALLDTAAEEAMHPDLGLVDVPDISDADLSSDLAGIRAKLQAPGEGFRDFVVAEEAVRGLPGLVNLIGIDSPGLTSSLALAEEVDRLLPD